MQRLSALVRAVGTGEPDCAGTGLRNQQAAGDAGLKAQRSREPGPCAARITGGASATRAKQASTKWFSAGTRP